MTIELFPPVTFSAMAMPERQTLVLNKFQFSYLEWQQGETPLLLLHGLADQGIVWSSLGDTLADRYHIVAPDMRGHGNSSKTKDGYTFAAAIADLELLMDSLGWQSAHIVGHSWTGKLATIWAQYHPTRFRSMTLVDPIFIWQLPAWVRLVFPLLYRVLPFLKGMGPFESYAVAEQQARQLKQYQGWSPLQQHVFRASIEQKPDGRWGSKFTRTARDRIFEDVIRVPGLSAPISIPTLFIQPEQGVNRTEWQLKPYKTHLNNLQICQLPGNHWPFLSQPDTFNRTIEIFLTNCS